MSPGVSGPGAAEAAAAAANGAENLLKKAKKNGAGKKAARKGLALSSVRPELVEGSRGRPEPVEVSAFSSVRPEPVEGERRRSLGLAQTGLELAPAQHVPAAPPEPPLPREPEPRVPLQAELPAGPEISLCPFPAKPGAERAPHHLLAFEGAAPDVLLAGLPPGNHRGPPAQLLYLAMGLVSRGTRAFAYDYNLATYLGTTEMTRSKWDEYQDAGYNVSETAMPAMRAWMSYERKAVQEIVALAPKALAMHVSPASMRAATELTAKLREARYDGPIYWFGAGVRRDLGEHLPPGAVPTAFVVGDPERGLPFLLKGETRPAGVALPGGLDFSPAAPIQKLGTLRLGDLGPLHLEGYSGAQIELLLGRGCSERCPHCPRAAHNLVLRSRQAEDVYLEMTRLHAEKGVSDFVVGETMANAEPKLLSGLASLIDKGGLPLVWEARYVPAEDEAPDHYRTLHAGGCRKLRFCIRTGPEGYRLPASFGRALRAAHLASIVTSLDTVPVGIPGQADEHFDELVKFFGEHGEWIDEIETLSDVLLLPGSEYDRQMQRHGITRLGKDLARDWHDNMYLNKEFRRKRLKELHLYLEGRGDIRLPSRERVFGMGGALLEQEARVKERLTALASRPADCVLVTTPAGEPVSSIEERPETLVEAAVDVAPPPSDDARQECVTSVEPSPIVEPEAQGRPDLEPTGAANGECAPEAVEPLEIDLTNDCNLSCAGCWFHSHLMGDRRYSGAFKRQFIPFETLCRVIDDAAERGTRFVRFSGSGEPMMHPNIWEVIRRVKARGLELTIVTNLTLVSEEGARNLVELGVDDLTVSVWASSPAGYERTHPGSHGEAFLRIEKTLSLLRELKGTRERPRVKIWNVVSRLNHDQIETMVDFALATGAQSCEFVPIETVEGYTDGLQPGPEQSAEVLEAFERLRSRGDRVDLPASFVLLGRERFAQRVSGEPKPGAGAVRPLARASSMSQERSEGVPGERPVDGPSPSDGDGNGTDPSANEETARIGAAVPLAGGVPGDEPVVSPERAVSRYR